MGDGDGCRSSGCGGWCWMADRSRTADADAGRCTMTEATRLTGYTGWSRVANNGRSQTSNGGTNWAVDTGGRTGDLWGDRYTGAVGMSSTGCGSWKRIRIYTALYRRWRIHTTAISTNNTTITTGIQRIHSYNTTSGLK